MKVKWLIYFVMLIKASTVSSQVKHFHSFRCLLEDTFEPCIVFPETSSQNVTVFSYKLINDYANLSVDVHHAIKQQNLTLISEEDLEKIPDAILLLLPANHLSSINNKYLMNLIIQRSRSPVVKHLVKAYFLRYGDEYFYEKLQTVDLPVRSLTWIADVISSSVYGAKEIINRPPLLFYSPPFSLLFNRTSEKLFHLSLWEKTNFISKEINKSYLRFWVYAMIKNSFPGPLNHWNDLCLERWGTLLTASTSDELKMLNHSNIDDLQLLFSIGFSTIQVRTIFEEFADQLMNSRLDYFTLSNLLIDLLPDQLLRLSKMIPYIEQLKVLPSIKSISTSKQIFEMLIFEKLRSEEDGHHYINNFSYVLPIKTLSESLKKPLTLSNLIKIQSSHFSKTQLYILSSRSAVFDFNSKYMFECRDLIKVLPARDIIFNQTASHVLLHLLSEVVADNIPQSLSIFNKLWTVVGSPSVFKKILANRDCDVLLQYIPSRFTAQFVDSILKMIGEDVNSHTKLPDSFVSSVLVSLREVEQNLSLLNTNASSEFLVNGISCDDISSLDPYDFVVFMSKFNEQRKASGKDFPKILQQCCIEKFLAYIDLRSSLFQGILGESKLSLLNEAEIDCIGGYIFCALPIEPIAKSKYSKRIIKSIGGLSLSELILAAPLLKLQKFGTVLIHDDYIEGKIIDYALFDLGNLTLFLDEKYITKISEIYFKLLLESNFIDRRVCANKSSRLVWFNFLRQCFGETSNWTYQTLITLGDLLIVVPAKELDKIPSNSWKYAADILISHYYDIVEYSHSLKFYEVCKMQLDFDEAQSFFDDLKYLVKVFVNAAQIQLNTVTTVEELGKKNNSYKEFFTFINSRKSNIRIYLPTIKNVINIEKPTMKNETPLQETESLNTDPTIFSKSDLDYESSSTTKFSNIYSTYSEDLSRTTVKTGCNNSTSCFNLFSEETSTPYADFITESFVNENSYSNFYEKSTTIEMSEKYSSVSEQSIIVLNSTKEANMSFSEETSILDEKHFYLTTPLDDEYIQYSESSEPTYNDNKSSFSNGVVNFNSNPGYGYSFENELDVNTDFVTPDHSYNVMQSSTYALNDKPTTSKIFSETYNNIYNLDSSDIYSSKVDSANENDSLTVLYSVTTPNNIITTDTSQSNVTYALKDKPTTSKIFSETYNNIYNLDSSDIYSSKVDSSNENDSLTELYSVTIPNNIITTDTSQTNVTTTVNTEKLATDSYNFLSRLNSTNSTFFNEKMQESKVIEKVHLENILNNNNVKTEFLNLNFPSVRSKLKKINPVIIGNARRERGKRSIGQYSCEALKMVGKSTEILVSEELIQTMSEEDLNGCVDLFSEMDLSVEVKNLIWSKLNLDNIFLYGKLVSAIKISDVKSMNFSISHPWALETIHLIGRYSSDPEVKEHIMKSIISSTKQRYTLEILVTLGALVCELPEINPQLIEPSEFLKASVILGRSLPCNYSCLQKFANIAMKEGAFEDPSEWNANDVSDLGVIVAGLERTNWKKILHSRKKPLKGISEQAFNCLPQEYIEEFLQQNNSNLTKIYLKGSTHLNTSIYYDFFGYSGDSVTASNEYISYSVQLTYFYLGLHLQILFIVIIITLNHY